MSDCAKAKCGGDQQGLWKKWSVWSEVGVVVAAVEGPVAVMANAEWARSGHALVTCALGEIVGPRDSGSVKLDYRKEMKVLI